MSDVLANGVRDQPELDGMSALDGTTLRVLLWNYHDELVPAPATPVHLTVQVPTSFGPTVRVSHLRVDETHGDAYAVWVAQGMPASPSTEQLTKLRQAMDPSLLVPTKAVAVTASGSVDLDFDLPRFGVSLVTLQPATGDGGAGGDGGADGDGSGARAGLAGSDGGATSTPAGTRNACACRLENASDAPHLASLLGLAAVAVPSLIRRHRRRIRRQTAT